MAVRRSDGKFSHPPRFVGRLVDSSYAVLQKFEIQIVDRIDRHICEVRVIASFRCWHCVWALTQHQSKLIPRQKCPALDLEIEREAELVKVERNRLFKVGYGEDALDSGQLCHFSPSDAAAIRMSGVCADDEHTDCLSKVLHTIQKRRIMHHILKLIAPSKVQEQSSKYKTQKPAPRRFLISLMSEKLDVLSLFLQKLNIAA